MQKLKKRIKTRQFWITVAPLLILLVTLSIYNLTTTRHAETAVATHPTLTLPRATRTPFPPGTRPPILQATILPSPTPTSTPRPDVLETAVITLLGPPDESSLPPDGRLAFYWAYTAPLQPRQQFVLTLRQNDANQVLGALNRPNFGDLFQIMVDFEAVEPAVGTAVWQVQLRWIDEERPLLTSEERLLTFLPE
ncbi:MAG: hypothetical protein IPM53_09355 [Anaerolineaceae bacterium]|nr:hypothetical protein [Anaerolineaceae bacterium]